MSGMRNDVRQDYEHSGREGAEQVRDVPRVIE